MTGWPFFAIEWRHCLILPFLAGMILTLQQFSIYFPLLTNSEIHMEAICYTSTIVRKSQYSAFDHNTYIICDKPMSTKHAEVSSYPPSEMRYMISEFPTLTSYSMYKL